MQTESTTTPQPKFVNSPTPRTDAATNRPRKCDPLVKAEFAQQLEREQQWMMEVIKRLAERLKASAQAYDFDAITAHAELKKYMEEKK